jgi:hypothetical protein
MNRITWTDDRPAFTGSVDGIELFRCTWDSSRDNPERPWLMTCSLPGLTSRRFHGRQPAEQRTRGERILTVWLARLTGLPVDLAYEALKGGRDPELAAAMDDLAALHAAGALAGVAETLRERRRQVEALGYTPEHDDRHDDGSLAADARFRLGHLLQSRVDGTSDIAGDEDKLRTASALAAAEIDRLNRMVTP